MLRVGYLNIFWSNGSYETPIKFPDPNTFHTLHPDEDNLYFENENLGFAVLKGDWNYAFYNNSFYFLDKIKALDIEDKTFKYTLTRDLNYELYKLEDLHIYGCLNKVTEETILRENLDLLTPLIDNPIDVELLNLERDDKENLHIDFKWVDTTKNIFGQIERRGTFLVNALPGAYITKKQWDTFISQYKKIPDKTKEYPRDAIFAFLPFSLGYDVWRDVISKKYLGEWLDDVRKNPNDYHLVQIGNIQSKLSGNFQLVKKTDQSLGIHSIPINSLKQLDFSNWEPSNKPYGLLKEIIPVHPDNLEPLVNTNVGFVPSTDDTPQETCIGVFKNGTDFYYTETPWNDAGGRAYKYDCGTGIGINNKLELMLVHGSSFDAFNKIYLGYSTLDKLKQKKAQLDKLDKLLKSNHPVQASFFKNISNYYKWQYIEYATPTFPSGFGDDNIDEYYWLSTGLPRKGNDYDYEEILRWIQESNVELFTTYLPLQLDKFYFLTWGKLKNSNWQKAMAFHSPSERTAVHTAIEALKDVAVKPNPESYKDLIVYKALERRENIINNKYYHHSDDYSQGLHLFNLLDTNYYLLINNGKSSLIFKDFAKDAVENWVEVYKYSNADDIHIPELINTKKWLNIYGKEYFITDKKKEIKNLEITRLTPDEKINPYEDLVVEYKSNYTSIFDTHPIPKEKVKDVLNNFNAVEYRNTLINYERAIEDHQINLEQIRINRNKEDFDIAISKEKWAEDYNRMIVNTIFTSVGVIAGSSIAALFTGGVGLSVIAGAASGIGKTISDAIYGFNSLDRSRRELKENEKRIAESRIIENFKLDANKRRLDFDNRRNIERMSNITTRTEVNDRDLLKRLQKKWNVGNVYLKTLKPSQKQLHEINAHYSHFGIDANIPKYSLIWKDVKDKLNIWGFKYIEDVNVKDPTLKLFVIGKFINGVKLIKPDFS